MDYVSHARFKCLFADIIIKLTCMEMCSLLRGREMALTDLNSLTYALKKWSNVGHL